MRSIELALGVAGIFTSGLLIGVWACARSIIKISRG